MKNLFIILILSTLSSVCWGKSFYLLPQNVENFSEFLYFQWDQQEEENDILFFHLKRCSLDHSYTLSELKEMIKTYPFRNCKNESSGEVSYISLKYFNDRTEELENSVWPFVSKSLGYLVGGLSGTATFGLLFSSGFFGSGLIISAITGQMSNHFSTSESVQASTKLGLYTTIKVIAAAATVALFSKGLRKTFDQFYEGMQTAVGFNHDYKVHQEVLLIQRLIKQHQDVENPFIFVKGLDSFVNALYEHPLVEL